MKVSAEMDTDFRRYGSPSWIRTSDIPLGVVLYLLSYWRIRYLLSKTKAETIICPQKKQKSQHRCVRFSDINNVM